VSFPGFRTIMTFACFRGLGQYPSLVIALSKCRIALRPSCRSSRIMSVVIWSGPGALRGWRCLTTPLSSPIVNAHSFSNDGAWIASFCIISGSGVSSWGLYNSVRWLANRLVFSVSLLTQGLGGFVFARIGGCGVRGFFLD
jgi:hypothetical protein